MHRPDTCFQASGAILDRELDPLTVAVGLTNLRFKSYLFQQSGQPLFVFFIIWEEANLDAASRTLGQDWSGWSRVQRAFQVLEDVSKRRGRIMSRRHVVGPG